MVQTARKPRSEPFAEACRKDRAAKYDVKRAGLLDDLADKPPRSVVGRAVDVPCLKPGGNSREGNSFCAEIAIFYWIVLGSPMVDDFR